MTTILPPRRPRLFRRALRCLLCLLALPLLYLLTALVLGLLPANRDWRAPAAGIPVYLDSNGVHAGLLLPRRAAGMDWDNEFSPQHPRLRPNLDKQPYVGIGWGSRSFFLDTQNWSDLTPGNALYALSGLDGTVLHVEYLPPPRENAATRRILLTPEQYRRLTGYIRSAIARDGAGQAVWMQGYHYHEQDAFYLANGRYSPLTTCNQWVRNALDASGVRTAWWSPFDRALFWQLKDR
ncbi:TIGR02117 family protein [Chromobacterium aquaticum]|uniref:TIGR02117 family protein n=1 Tax=Chromobacterium aquaticum TaxID=467180 RepID=A0ABV8ZXW6_9NEIS|nr:TIGR02117 family protein [Chromobacterium aquaticum]MCD5361332.1 TIGR02117 family protein [Chromobacterium aquaticum]